MNEASGITRRSSQIKRRQYLKDKPRIPLPAVYRPKFSFSIGKDGKPRMHYHLDRSQKAVHQRSQLHWMRPEKVSNGKRSEAKRTAWLNYLYESAMLNGFERELRAAGFKWRDYELKRVPQEILKETMTRVARTGPLIVAKISSAYASIDVGRGLRARPI